MRIKIRTYHALFLVAAVLMNRSTARASATGPASRASYTIKATTYQGRAAYRLSDGRSEAVIVPALAGRVMRYGFIGGPNMLWNAPPGKKFKAGEWKNWGGDKVWPAPQGNWGMLGSGWPPDPTFDSLPHRAAVLPATSASAGSGGRANPARPLRLRLSGPLMKGFGTRIVREYFFDRNGDLVIEQRLRKEAGAPVQVSLWNVTQVPPPNAVFVPLNPQSAYKNNFHWFGGKAPQLHATSPLSATLLRFKPTSGFYKIGVDAPIVAIAGVRDGVALLQRAHRAEGEYPEGAAGNGFPITIWNQGEKDAAARYVEMEMMSPLQALKVGQTISHTLRWSLHRLPSTSADSPTVRAAVEKLLRAPF